MAKRHTRAFKRTVVLNYRVFGSAKRSAEIYGVSLQSVYRWARQFRFRRHNKAGYGSLPKPALVVAAAPPPPSKVQQTRALLHRLVDVLITE